MSADFYVDELTQNDDFKMIAEHFEFGRARFGDKLEDVLRWLVKIGCKGLGAYEQNTNKLVSWVMTDVDGQGLIGHTLKDYRQLGLQAWVLMEVVQREYFSSFDGVGVGYVGVENKNSFKKCLQLGGTPHKKLCANFVVRKCNNSDKL